MIYRTISTTCLCAFLALGCATTSEPESPTPAAPERSTDATAILEEAARTPLDPIYFDTDRAGLSEKARTTLERHAEAILADQGGGVVTIEGHCDERGSDEYNLALGERRAEVVSRYLKKLGVPASRLQTRTRGETQPAVAGHGESAWGLNRRAEIQGESKDLAQR